MTDRPLGAQIDAVLERLHAHGRGSTGGAIREVLDEYADALTVDMRSTAFRETDRGAEIFILGSRRISLISVDFDESTVRFETRGLHDAVVSLETTGLNIPDGTPVSAKRRWRFKFPDGSALAIDGTLTHGRRDNLDRFAADVMSEVGVQESVRDQEPQTSSGRTRMFRNEPAGDVSRSQTSGVTRLPRPSAGTAKGSDRRMQRSRPGRWGSVSRRGRQHSCFASALRPISTTGEALGGSSGSAGASEVRVRRHRARSLGV